MIIFFLLLTVKYVVLRSTLHKVKMKPQTKVASRLWTPIAILTRKLLFKKGRYTFKGM